MCIMSYLDVNIGLVTGRQCLTLLSVICCKYVCIFSIGTPQSNANLFQSASWKTCRLRLHLQIVVLLHNLLNCDVLVSRTTLNALNDEHCVGYTVGPFLVMCC